MRRAKAVAVVRAEEIEIVRAALARALPLEVVTMMTFRGPRRWQRRRRLQPTAPRE